MSCGRCQSGYSESYTYKYRCEWFLPCITDGSLRLKYKAQAVNCSGNGFTFELCTGAEAVDGCC